MTMNRSVAKLRITRDLHEAEAALNQALVRQAALFSTIVKARCEVSASAFEGQDILLRLSQCQRNLLAACHDLSRVHIGLLRFETSQRAETGFRIERCPPPAGLSNSNDRVADA